MKKKIFITLLSCSIVLSPALFADDLDISEVVEEMNDLHRPNLCAEDGAFTAVSSSMFGWGIGLAVGIALLTGLLHQSTSSSH